MNVQKMRDSLKRDVFKFLSNRPDGVPTEELWSEVSRWVGHEIKAKDYLVPNLSYFLYLWESDFRIAENRIHLRNAYFTSQGPATANTSSQSTSSSSASYEVSQHQPMEQMSGIYQNWMTNTQNSSYSHDFDTTDQPGNVSPTTVLGQRTDMANDITNVNVRHLDHTPQNMVQKSDHGLQNTEYGWQNKSYNLQYPEYGTQIPKHRVKDNQCRATNVEYDAQNADYVVQDEQHGAKNMGTYPSYSTNTNTTIQGQGEYRSDNMPHLDSSGYRSTGSYQMSGDEMHADRSMLKQSINTRYIQAQHNIDVPAQKASAMDLLKRTGYGPRLNAPDIQGNLVQAASIPHTRYPSAHQSRSFPQQYQTQSSNSATEGNSCNAQDTQQNQGSQVSTAQRGSRLDDRGSTGQKFHHDIFLDDTDLKNLHDFIVTKLKGFRRGINLEQLYNHVLSYGKGVEMIIQNSGGFQEFLYDYMSDVLSYNESNLVCLSEYQTQNDTEVVDLTGVSGPFNSRRAETLTNEMSRMETPQQLEEFQAKRNRSSKKEKGKRQLKAVPLVKEEIALKAINMPLERSSYSQEVGNYRDVSHEELAKLKNVIINRLEGHSCGIRSKKLITKLEPCRNVLEKVLRESGSFLQFLEDQMSDVLSVSKSQVVCLRQYQEQSQAEDHVIDLTNENTDEKANENNLAFQQNNQGQLDYAQGTNTGFIAPRNLQRNSAGLGFDTEFTDIDVRPIEKKEFEKRDIVVVPLNIPRNVPVSLDFVNAIAGECIETLSSANEFVMPERVEKMIFQRFQIQHPRQIGLNSVYNIPCIDELKRLLNRIHGYIIGFVKTRPICTLYELEDALKSYVGNHEDFSNLKVGPLQRSPVVFQHFKFPPDQEIIPAITSTDVLEHFQNFMNTEETWNGKPELEPFMEYLAYEYKAEDAYYLGVRIISLPLLASILRKAHYDSLKNKKQVFEFYKDKLKREMDDAFRVFRASMLQSGDGDELEVRKEAYLKMKPDDVIIEIFGKFNHLMTSIKIRDISRGQQKQMMRLVEDYVGLLRKNPMFRCMFNLSVCMSNTEVDQTVVEMLKPAENVQVKKSVEEPVKEVRPPPRKDKVVQLIQTYIERCLNAGSLSLVHLDRIEEKLMEEFSIEEFQEMGYGRFIHFLITEMKQILEEGGGLTLGSNPVASHDSTFKPELTEIQEFIKQCHACGISQSEEIENALCKHYGVKEVHHLGYGNMNRLLSHAEKHRLSAFSDFTIYYQSAFIKPSSFGMKNKKVGVLGHQTRDLAKICLHNCPLLEDLAEWSQWSLVFEPELGKLKDFVQKYGGVTNKTLEAGGVATLDFLALETKPGVLLKIVSNTSAELVVEALERRDIEKFCGHLVSMMISFKGVTNLPKALLAGHVKTALLQLHASDPESETPGAPSTFISQNSACQFVLQCLLRIPTKICVDLADDLLLSPLGQVVGSTKFKQVLVQLCSSVKELNHLSELGCLLGIQEWTNHMSQKCVLPESSIQKISPDSEELFNKESQEKVNVEEMEEEDNESDVQLMVVDEDVTGVDGNVNINDCKKSIVKDNQANVIETEGTKEAKDENKTGDISMETESKKVTVDANVRSCEDIINEIRKEEFGVGVELSEDGQRLMKVQQERLGRSLDRLSKDLYSKDTHFVLELIQNADDNSYHENLLSYTNDLCPSVKFVIDEDSVCVRNNELGFKERDIRALCDVGRSTKGKHKVGYIGQKGIGFKSVFRVTDTPEIHSNGFHMKFDVNSGPMGYILPHWSELTDRVDDSWTTNIILTLKPDIKQQARTLAARFNDIHPSLLLFLHRLREITVENKVENKVQTMRRRDVGENIVEIQHSDGLDRWLVTKKMLDASKISSQAKSGAHVESTEIALAFPLRAVAEKLHMQNLPVRQPVFAFLPLRSYGFRFIVQGDFDVPSSREDVDRDSSWNQWLRNEIHTLFLDSLYRFKSHQEFSNVEAVISYLQFVPMEDEVLDFFKPVASDILKKLKARPCVPTQPNSEGVISWKIPSQTVRVRDPLVRSVITPELLQKHLNLHYLHPDVASMLNPTLISCLGIETLTSEHLFHLGKALVADMNGHCGTPYELLLIAQWLACLYRCLDEFHDNTVLYSTLKSLKLVPLSDGRLVSLQENTVFTPFPIKSESNKHKMDLLGPLLNDLNCLHHMLMNTDDDEVNGQVHKLMSRLGVKELSPLNIVNHHIIPVFKTEQWKEKSEATLVSYITFIKGQIDRNVTVCNLEELGEIVQLVTNKGIRNPKTVPIHFPSQYGATSVDLQRLFPGYDWTVVDPVYLPPQPSHLTLVSWHDFFVKLGVEDYFSIQQREVCLKTEDLETSQWKSECKFWPQGETEYVIQDCQSEELEGLIIQNKHTSEEAFQEQMRALCLCLEKLWDSKFSRYTKTSVSDKKGQTMNNTKTSFSNLLQTSCWLPTLKCECAVETNGNLTVSKTIEMMEPACMYIYSDETEKLLFNKVPYLDVDLTLKNSFHEFLGLKNSVTVETMKNYLIQWCKRTELDKAVEFCTSLRHIKHVYGYLGEKLNRGELQNLFQNHPVYFVPPKVSRSDEIVVGKFCSKKELWLADKTGLFNKYRDIVGKFDSGICKKQTLSGFYDDTPELINIFKQDGNVDQEPQIEEYLELASLLCSTCTPRDLPVLQDVLYIFATIGRALTHPPEIQDAKTMEKSVELLKERVKKKMHQLKVLPTKKGLWVSLNDKPMIADNRDLEKMFAGRDDVHFLDLEDTHGHSKIGNREKFRQGQQQSEQKEMMDLLTDVCGVKKLSECITKQIMSSSEDPCPSQQDYFHVIIPIIQQYLMARYKDVYRNCQLKNTKELFQDAEFYQAEKLEVLYRLTVTEKPTQKIQDEKCVISPPTFYFQKDHVDSIHEVNREIARYFSQGDIGCNTALRSFLSELHNIYTGITKDTVNMLLHRHEADGIVVQEDDVWHVAPPIMSEPIQDCQEEYPAQYVLEGPDQFGYRKDSNISTSWPPFVPNSGVIPMENVNPSPFKTQQSAQVTEYMRSVKDLPSNIKMAGPEESIQVTEITDISEDKEGQNNSNAKLETMVKADSTGRGHGYPGNLGNTEGKFDNQNTAARKRKLSEEDVDEKPDIKRVHGEYNTSNDNQDITDTRRTSSLVHKLESGPDDKESVEQVSGQNSTQEDIPGNAAATGVFSDRKITPIRGDPIWTQVASDYIVDQLGSGLELPPTVTLMEGAGDPEIGRWGEKLVAEYLEQQKQAGNITDFLWNNNENETGAPYDFVVQIAEEAGVREDFIEVKSTTSENKEMFEISVQQIKFAEEQRGKFHIYRVFNAGNPDTVRLTRIFDLSMRLNQKQVKLCLFI